MRSPARIMARSRLSVLDELLRGFDDLAVEPPAGWSKRTIVTFTAPAPAEQTQRDGEPPPSFVVIREPMREGESLRGLVEQRREEVQGMLAHSMPHHVDGHDALTYTCEWSGPTGDIYEATTLIETFERDGRYVTKVTATCSEEDAPEVQEAFTRLFESARFLGDPRPSSEPPPSSNFRPTRSSWPDPPESPLPEVPMPGERRRR